MGPAAIHAELCNEFYENVVSLKTVKNWLAEFRRSTKDGDRSESEIAKFLDRYECFTWNDFGKYEVPWEASTFVAKLMVENVSISLKNNSWYRDLSRIEITWIWRFHLVAPTLPIDSLIEMKEQITLEETRSVLTGEPVDFDALFWWLAHSPWENSEKQKAYELAVSTRYYVPRYDEEVHQQRALEVMKQASTLDPRSDLYDIATGTAEEITRYNRGGQK